MEVSKKIQNWVELKQALINQILSDLHSHTPVLQYLFVNILPYQNIYMC